MADTIHGALDGTSPGDPIVDVAGLTYRYPGAERPAVDRIDFRVRRGEIFGFLGPSGAGKSTTQKVLTRLLRDYGGQARVLGREIRDWGHDYFERVGVSFELPSNYRKLTAVENLELFGALYSVPTEDPRALLEAVDLGDAADMRVGEFSKGMHMRLNVVRALVNRPELCFLDEPTSGMDPVNARRIMDLVAARRDAGATVFLTTHDMRVADTLCDRVAFMVDGKLAVIDSPRALKLAHGRRRVVVEHRSDGVLERAEFELDGPEGRGELGRLLAAEREIETIHTEEATLEQVFIALTGRSLS